MAYPNYEYTEKEVEIYGKKYKAKFIKSHTSIKGIVYEWYDRNADDYPWANRSDWHLTFFVLQKRFDNRDEWRETAYNGRDLWGNRASLNEILFALESIEFKNKIEKENRIEELKSGIEELKLRIKKDSKELSQLLKG